MPESELYINGAFVTFANHKCLSINNYIITQVILAYDLLEDRRTIDVISKFSFCVLKWWNVLRIKVIFYVTGQEIRYKKSCRGFEQVRKAERRKIKPFLF